MKLKNLFVLWMALASMVAVPAFAVGATPGQSVVSSVIGWISVLGGSLGVLAIMLAGIKMMFSGARFADVQHIFIGGIVFGSAGAIGAMLFF